MKKEKLFLALPILAGAKISNSTFKLEPILYPISGLSLASITTNTADKRGE